MKRTRPLKRSAKIVLLVLAGVVVALVALFIAWAVTSPPASSPTPVEARPIPEIWATPSEEAPVTDDSSLWTSVGSLAVVADGRTFGDESYRLDVSREGARLTSSGRFWFKILLANVAIAFRQEWEGTASFEPVSFSLHVDAPLGRGYEVEGNVVNDAFVLARGSTVTTTPMDVSRGIVLGMFSTYALIPAEFAERNREGVATFDVLVLGGPPGADAGSETHELPTLVVERMGEASIAVGDRTLSIDCYRIESPYGDSVLYAKGREFLALVAGATDRPLVVYRSDYFPDGFPVREAGR